MRILFQNYTSDISTESMYFDGCFKRTPSITSSIWSGNVSAFDAMDSFSPDVLVCHFAKVTQDIVKYLSRNNGKCKLVMNITGATQENVDMIEGAMVGNKIECPFMFYNTPDAVFGGIQSKSIKMVNILPGTDLFLTGTDNELTFSVEAGIISTSKPDLVNSIAVNYQTCHKLKLAGRSEDPSYDVSVNIMNMTNLYDKYEKVVIADDVELMFSQIAFDSMAKAKRTIFQTSDAQKDKMDKVISSLFYDDGGEDTFESIRKQIRSKHTCFNRASRLARLLGLSEEAITLQKVVDAA